MRNRQWTKDFLIAALIRATKTAAQVMLSMITVGAAITSFDWIQILSITGTSFVYSILTSIVFGIPEGEFQGTLTFSMKEAEHDGEVIPVLKITTPGDELIERNNINLKVEKEI